MLTYVGRRLLASVPVLVVVVLLAFLLLHVGPADPAALIAGDQATPEQVERLRRAMGLDRPLPAQLASWLGQIARGDLGTSLFTGERLTTLLGQRFPATLSLAALGEALGVALGVPLGILAARRRGSGVDRAVMAFAVLGFAAPAFLLGYGLSFAFSLGLGWLPPTGYEPPGGGLGPFLRHLVLPAATLGLGVAALVARMTRATMLEVLGQDYVRTARAKGLRERAVLLRHAARNAAVPVVTVVGLSAASVLAGAAVIETVFSIPGLGLLFVHAATNRDYPIVQGMVLVTGTLVVLVNLVVDLSYPAFDPRLRR